MIKPTINFRVLLLAILPTVAVSAVFFTYFVGEKIKEIENNLIDRGQALASHLASASEYGVFSGNMTILNPLVDSAFTQSDIISITITNNQNDPLIEKKRNKVARSTEDSSNSDHNHVFREPIKQHAIDINDFEPLDNAAPPVIGWVTVEISNENAYRKKKTSVLHTLAITLLILISSIILATRISRKITEPITSLTNSVKEIESGNLDVSIKPHSTGAILTLEEGVRSMLLSIKSSHQASQEKIEKATRELRDSLELLEQKNIELTKARLQALSASQAKSAFLANISHEIRTPMNGILGFVRLLSSTNPTQEQKDYLFTIEQSAHNLLKIINDVLDFSKIEAGKIAINNLNFDLEECIDDVLVLVAPSAHEKKIEIASLYYEDTPKILTGAVDRIRQILINLIGNAIKFSSDGTVTIRTMLVSQKDEHLKIKIAISDQGKGISDKDKTILFKKFSQIDESSTRQYGGTGLGLAISKSLAEAMNGEIGIENNEDKGSTFWFTFESKTTDPSAVFSTRNPSLYKNKSVWIYDSNEITRLSLYHTFRKQGFAVIEYDDTEELCSLPNGTPDPDLIALSLNYEQATDLATKDLLANLRTQFETKIIVFVSSSNLLILNNLKEWGADRCLSKPFRHNDFDTKLALIFPQPDANKSYNVDKSEQPDIQVNLQGLHILVAEDNPINAKLIQTVLQRAGAQSTVVDNGVKVLNALANARFDVILMDIHMPEMNGIDAARKIRETEDSSERIAIIGLTAASKTKEDRLLRNTDFNEIFEKPISVDELLHEITFWVNERKSFANLKQSTYTGSTRLGIDNHLSDTLNEMLIRELPNTKKKLLTAYNKSDYAFLRHEIHRMLGGMAYCNYTKLHNLVLRYQTSLKAGADSMDTDFQAMIAEIDRMLSSSTKASKS